MSDDLIKRSDAIKAFVEETNGVNVEEAIKVVDAYLQIRECDEVWDSIRAIRDCLECAKDDIAEFVPSADRPQGEWILLEPRYPIEQKVYWNKEQALADTKGNGARERRKCSCCGYTKSFMCHMKDEQIKLWNFCPNCGADMRGADDEDN